MKFCVLNLLIWLSLSFVIQTPTTVDDLSLSLLKAQDDVSVILVYNKVKPDIVVHTPFYVMFDP